MPVERLRSRVRRPNKSRSTRIARPDSWREGFSNLSLIIQDLSAILSKIRKGGVKVCQNRAKPSQDVEHVDLLIL